MKKIILSSLIIATLGLTVIGCNKEKITSNNQIDNKALDFEKKIVNGLTLNNNLLNFDSEETFERIVNDLHSINSLDEWEQKINFNSYRSFNNLEKQIELAEDSGFEHPFSDLPLATVINDKGFISIENWVFKFIIDNKEVRVLDKENIDEIPLFLQSEITEHTLSYNFEDDIWGELKENQSNKWPWNCDEKCAKSKTKKYNDQNWTQYCSYTVDGKKKPKTFKFYVFLKERYDNWGLYRKLYTHFKHKESGSGASDVTAFNIGYDYTYKVKCRSNYGDITHAIPMQPGSPLTPTTYEFTATGKEIEHYKGTRCLTTFSLSSWASYQSRCSYGMEQIYDIGTITQ